MADPLPLYEFPPHPFEPTKRDFSGEAKVCSTRTQMPISYYLVDFGLSRHYNPEGPPLELPPWGGDDSAPADTPCDPFPVDAYCLGNVIRTCYLVVRFVFMIIISSEMLL
jgi:hypothetical protein